MRKTMKWAIACMMALCASVTLMSCSDDDGKVDVSAGEIAGHWICVYQHWVDWGDVYDADYEPDGEYYITLNEDGTGELDSGSDQLMEIWGFMRFTWTVQGNRLLLFDERDWIEEEEVFEVKRLTDNELELCWDDGEVVITCRFVRAD